MPPEEKMQGAIEIDDTVYYWRVSHTNVKIRVDEETYAEISRNVVLTIIPGHNRSAKIHVRFKDEVVQMIWFAEEFSERVVTITPMIVRQVINFALQRRWNPDGQDEVLTIDKAERKFPGAISTFGVNRLRDFWQQVNAL
ncbi:MAG: hypothetical protein D6737_19570 [Chloroflexi bacterium]|nr:MAG: hypothetical protein D6737_19570 [Chloroflexota bacterium]